MKKTIFLFFAAILCAVGMNAYGATQRYIYVGLSNNYHQWKNESQWGINHWGGTGGGVVPGSKITDLQTTITHSGCTFHMYRMYVYDDNKNFEFKGNDGWWDCKKENISISGTTKNAILFRDNDGGDGGNPTFYQTDYKETSTVSLSASAASVSVGEEVTLTPTLTSNAEFNEIKSITYSVGTGATVSTDGKFVATAAGTYTVTATITYNPKHFTGITTEVNNLTCEIVVSEVVVPHPVTDVTVNPTSVTIKQGATATLTATVAPSNADDPSVTWSSDNQSVATVDNGIVTAVAPGTANITVTTVDGGFTATCAVKVKPLQYTFYAINSAEWPTVAAHYWEGADGGSAWPGANMVKESETINGFDIYSITISSDFVNIMFTNQIDGDNNKKTADLTTEGNNGKYYDIKDAKWYASLSEVPVSYDYYITGSLVGGWDPKQKGIEKDGELYKATFTDLAAGEYEFKITKGDWAQQWNYSNLDKAYEEVSEGKDGEGNPNGNIKIVTTAVKTITVIFDATANKISLEGLTPYVAPLTYTVTVPAGTEKCFIAGAMNGWNFQEMTATANANEFTIEIAGARETDGYKYACQASWDYVEKKEDGNDLDANRTWTANDVVAKWGVPPTYTIVGATAITGANWDPANAENLMTKDGEVYTLTKNGLQLEAGDYEYKVAKNGAWGDGQYPAEGNQKVNIAENGVYTIVYTYTVGTSLTAVPTKTGEYTPVQTVYTVAGDAALCGTNWQADDATNDMTANGDGTYTWTKTGVTLTGNVGFKVVKNHDFGNGEYPAENWNINLANYEGAAVYTVTITFTESSKEIAVTLTKTGDATPPVITYVLMGVDADWTTGIELTRNEANTDYEEYMLTCQVISISDAVKVVKLENGVSTEYYGTANYDENFDNFVENDANGNIVLYDGTYDFYFKPGDGTIWIANATNCPEEVELVATDLLIEESTLIGSAGMVNPFTFMLTLVDFDGSYKEYTLSDESIVRYGSMGRFSSPVTGSMTKSYDEDMETDIFTGVVYATMDEVNYKINLTMYNYVVSEEIHGEATVTMDGGDLTMIVDWEGTPVTIVLPEFDAIGVKEYGEITIEIGSDEDAYYAFGEPSVTVKDGEVFVEGEFYSYFTETTYNVFVWGLAPTTDPVEPTPDYTRTVTSGNYGTICLPFGGEIKGAVLYECVGSETGKVYLGSVTELEAGVPYIFQATATELAVYSDGTTAATPGDHNGLHGTFTDNTEVAVGNYILKDNAICEVAATCWVNAYCAYIVWGELPTGVPTQMPGRRYIGMGVHGENGTTGLDNIMTTDAPVKAIENGQLIIIRGGEKFNAQGVRL